MESGAGVRPAADAFRQNGHEIGHRSRRDFPEKTDLDPAQLVAGYLHVQVRHVGDRERLDVLNSATQRTYWFSLSGTCGAPLRIPNSFSLSIVYVDLAL